MIAAQSGDWILVLSWFVWAGVGAFVGRAIGKSKHNATQGFWLGFFMGWVGWLIIAAMKSAPDPLHPAPRCPWCSQLIHPQAAICHHCHHEFAPTMQGDAQWVPDPFLRYEMRYWNGRSWTDRVAIGRQQFVDAPGAR